MQELTETAPRYVTNCSGAADSAQPSRSLDLVCKHHATACAIGYGKACAGAGGCGAGSRRTCAGLGRRGFWLRCERLLSCLRSAGHSVSTWQRGGISHASTAVHLDHWDSSARRRGDNTPWRRPLQRGPRPEARHMRSRRLPSLRIRLEMERELVSLRRPGTLSTGVKSAGVRE